MKDIDTALVLLVIIITSILVGVAVSEKTTTITCESKGEALEAVVYNEKKNQIILQCKK